MSKSVLNDIIMAPKDPILGVTEAFNADTNPKKVNLGVGVYTDDNGKVPVLHCVRQAEVALTETAQPRNYLPIDGLATYDRALQETLFGAQSPAVTTGNIVTVQTIGGTGALKVGADFLRKFAPQADIYISDPSWENHRAIFEFAGFKVNTYPYYDPATNGLKFDAMRAALEQLPAGNIVLLHACCHNPTGVDLNAAQWADMIKIVEQRQLIPFLDIAYQGFADGLEEDAATIRQFADECPVAFVSSSFSKSLSLYGERVGGLSIVTTSKDEAARTLSQLKRVIRTNYSSPATHGAQTVGMVLNTPSLRVQWDQELGEMRNRIKLMRQTLVTKIREIRSDLDLSFITSQRGMFSYSGLNKDQVLSLREKYSIYAIDSGRICIAALNSKNIDYVANAIAEVMTPD